MFLSHMYYKLVAILAITQCNSLDNVISYFSLDCKLPVKAYKLRHHRLNKILPLN